MKNQTSHQLTLRIRELFLERKWIANTNYKEQIESISWKQAIKQVNNLNSIALLTFHVNYYLGGVISVLNGGPLSIRDKFSFDIPPINSEADWKNLASNFIANAEEFAALVEKLDDHRLNQPFVDEKYGTYQRNIEGLIEHSYYHLGQISLIRKMIS